MQYYYPDSLAIECKISGVWYDITSDVVGTLSFQKGIFGNKWDDRVAPTGMCKFSLNNSASNSHATLNYYLPGLGGSMVGWTQGIPVRFSVTYQSNKRCRFYGHVTRLEFDAKSKLCKVTCEDSMDYLSNIPISQPNVVYSSRIDQIAPFIVAQLPIQPLATRYYQGQDVFPTAFDTTKSTTTALGELSKLVISELGYAYIRNDENDELLVVEGRHTRNQTNVLSVIPAEDGYLLVEDGTFLLCEDGSKLINSNAINASFTDFSSDIKTDYGQNQLNKVTVTCYPRTVDTVKRILCTLNCSLNPNETKTAIKVAFKDPDGRATKISGTGITLPLVAWVDYKMNNAPDGSGLDITLNLTVTPTILTDGVLFTVSNNSYLSGYVTVNISGYGIYIYDSQDSTVIDSSINTFGTLDLSLDQKYQSNPEISKTLASMILAKEVSPRMVLSTVETNANLSSDLLSAFLYLDIGSLVHVQDWNGTVNNDFYIQGMKANIEGKLINFSWFLIDAIQLHENYWQLGVSGLSDLGVDTYLGY